MLIDNEFEANRSFIDRYNLTYAQAIKAIKADDDKKWRAEHKEQISEYRKQYRKEHAADCRRRQKTREIRAKNSSKTLTKSQWEKAIEYFGGKCAYCGEEKPLQTDHFVPLVDGGGYDADNILPCCLACNSSKSTKSFWVWYPKQPFYTLSRKMKILAYISARRKERADSSNDTEQSEVTVF